MHRLVVAGLMGLLGGFCVPASDAQTLSGAAPSWALRTRAVMTGVSDSSEPAGYKVYSGIGLEVDATRSLNDRLVLSMTSGTHSREIEQSVPGLKTNLGSVEVLPIDVLLQYQLHPTGRFHPYIGAGAAFSLFWEKSGSLDSTDLQPAAGPALSVGFDYDISPRTIFSAEFRARRQSTDIEREGTTLATLALHPSTLSVGFGFRF